jgi:hypothetical protein
VNTFDAQEYAKSLSPTLPVPQRDKYLEYWSEAFTLIQQEDCTFIVLNTAAYHGGGKAPAAEKEYGRISEATIAKIRRTLSSTPTTPINVLLCHHHPIKTDLSDREFEGATRGGDRLVELLGEDVRPWLIVHGHKHVPDLFYGHGGANAPVVLSCASFSAQVNVDAQNKNPNQVHYVELDPEYAARQGLASAGAVRSWTWQPGGGWRRARGAQGMPHRAGFGYRSSLLTLADRITSHVDSTESKLSTWEAVQESVPVVSNLIPNDAALLEAMLLNRGIAILTDRDGRVAEVGRSA